MPKRTDIHSILIIGAGPIIIGQACEFDYAGTQACKALKEEGYRIILVNSNPATMMTDPDMADATYIEPLTVESLEKIIIKERPQALLPTLGGQTALNCALALAKQGILERYHIELIGASIKAIELAENRSLFHDLMKKINLETPASFKIKNIEESKNILKMISFPVIIRPSFALGGTGAGLAYDEKEFLNLCENAFAVSDLQEITIDEALIGWKEFELEVIRDRFDNCIIVCGVENLDPLGVHTGDSITVAPIQTLTDKEYQAMRQDAFSILRAVGVDTGGSNVQFAVHPTTGRRVVIEMNPRVSRSSALVSKASGFPIAKIAAKLAVGYTLDELRNDITGDQLPSSFEPSLDYVVVKIPRFNFEKFPQQENKKGPQMRSVGEVMGIGRTFEEALQKALASLENKNSGFSTIFENLTWDDLKNKIKENGSEQLEAIAEAFRQDKTPRELFELTYIDPWFLEKINSLIQIEKNIKKNKIDDLTLDVLKSYKRQGFSDAHIAACVNSSEEDIRQLRYAMLLHPVYKRVDSCAGEFFTPTAYLYSTYERICEAAPSQKEKILIIGSGPNRIGQGIEFDYCCVHAVKALKKRDYETIMVNCNPETVSTDYDIADRLYFSPLTLEEVLEIIRLEKPKGVFLQWGGQTPLKLAEDLAKVGINLLGLDMQAVHKTEDRYAFQQLLHTLKLKQPENHCVSTIQEGEKTAKQMGFPLIIRPSFVLGGAAMSIINEMEKLKIYLEKAFAMDDRYPVLIEKFLEEALEVDVDVITDGEEVFIPAFLEHIELAGVHSGDSACITPMLNLNKEIQENLKEQIQKIANHLNLKGIFNVQFAIQNQTIYIIEVNPRASRTLPFVCKATGIPLVELAVYCALGEKLQTQSFSSIQSLPYYCVKEAVLPFSKFSKSPVFLGPEMKSTGEVMGIGSTPSEAYAKAQIASGNPLPKPGLAYIVASLQDKKFFSEKLKQLGFKITSKLSSDCALIIAINAFFDPHEEALKAARFAVDKEICYVTSHRAALMLIGALDYYLKESFQVTSLQNLYKRQIKHFLTGEELSPDELKKILNTALILKKDRFKKNEKLILEKKQLALLFDKPSLRTRFSFTVAMRELGGDVIESIQTTRKEETPEDQARVLSAYCSGIVVRTFDDEYLKKMSSMSTVPVINGLSDLHHPCQILADLLTLLEHFSSFQNVTLCYIGDGNNILHSLLLLAPQMGVTLHYCCPAKRQPHSEILKRSLEKLNSLTGKIISFTSPEAAIKHANAVYTDVWTSMGFEEKAEESLFQGFQINEALMQKAMPHAILMHCLPMQRGKEISETLPEKAESVIFQQSENRLHVQKSLLLMLLKGK